MDRQVPPTFAPPATLFLASSPEATASFRAAAAIFGAPLDLTESFRDGAGDGPTAVRSMSDSLESYSPILDRDLADLAVCDFGDLDLNHLAVEEALEAVSQAAAYA